MKIRRHSKYNDKVHYATKTRKWDRITANIVNNWNRYNITFFDKNVVQVWEIEKFYNLELAKLYAECFMQGYFIY